MREKAIYYFYLEVIKSTLKSKGLAQTDLAKALSMDNATLSRMISTDNAKTKVLEKIAEFLELPLTSFIMVDGEPLERALDDYHKDHEKKKVGWLMIAEEKRRLEKDNGRLEKIVDTQAKYIKLMENKISSGSTEK